MNFLIRELGINLEMWPDDAHGINNDLELTLKDCDLWAHTLLMLTGWNAVHGPFASDLCFHQIRDGLEESFAFIEPSSDSLLQHLAKPILRDRNELHMQGCPDVEDHIKQAIQTASCFWKKGRKTSLSRFLDILRKSEQEDQWWHTRLYGMLNALFLLGKLDQTSEVEFSSVVQSSVTFE